MNQSIETMITIQTSTCLWFTEYDLKEEAILTPDASLQTPKASLNLNFDYEKIDDIHWLLYLDIGFDLKPVAKICNRTSFKVNCNEETLFTNQTLIKMIPEALKNCIKEFNNCCKAAGLKSDWEPTGIEKSNESFAKTLIHQYSSSRKYDDIRNKSLMTEGLSLTPGRLTNLAVKLTFTIMDELLFLNKNFDTPHNRNQLNKQIPIPYFYTLKVKCLVLEKEKINLTWMQTVFFFLSMECALQMLIGDHYEKLISSLEVKGITNKDCDSFISYGTKLLAEMHAHLKKMGTNISNLEEKHDWNLLIR